MSKNPFKTSAKQTWDRGCDSQLRPRPRLNSQPQKTTKKESQTGLGSLKELLDPGTLAILGLKTPGDSCKGRGRLATVPLAVFQSHTVFRWAPMSAVCFNLLSLSLFIARLALVSAIFSNAPMYHQIFPITYKNKFWKQLIS